MAARTAEQEIAAALAETERARDLLREAQQIAQLGNTEFFVPDTGTSYWSPQVYRILGIDPRETGSHVRIFERLHPDDRERCLAAWAAAIREPGTFSLSYRFVRPDGELRHIEARYQLTRVEGGRLRAIGTIHDVTERKRAENEAREAQERLDTMSRLASLGETAAGISHELNQPLAAIANYSQACSRLIGVPEPDLAEVSSALAEISAQALRAGEIIRRFRGFARNPEIRRESLDANELVREIASLLELDSRMHQTRLRYELADPLPHVAADRLQIQQVVVNLAHNAVEAVADQPNGEVVIATQVAASGGVLIAVRDNGPGLPPSLEQRIFEPFFTTKPQGTGLGLAISRSIIEAHRARLSFRRLDGGGSGFEFALPAADAA